MSPSEPHAFENVEPWSRLWRSGVLHSCATGIPGNYDGAILAFWQARFIHLTDGDRVVDIGTGNGAVALLAKDSATRRGIGLDIHGVDIAAINPMATMSDGGTRYAGISFHPNTSVTHLPFGDGEIALVCSQYAFEYAPREAAIAEINRVIGLTGRAAFVLHSDESIIARVANQQLQGCEYMERFDLFDRTRTLIRILARARTPAQRAALAHDRRAEAARAAFNASAQGLMEKISELDAADILRKAAQHVRNALELANRSEYAALQSLDAAHSALQDEHVRLLQLRAAIVDTENLATICAGFRAAGHAVTHAALDQLDGVRMGWTMIVGNE